MLDSTPDIGHEEQVSEIWVMYILMKIEKSK